MSKLLGWILIAFAIIAAGVIAWCAYNSGANALDFLMIGIVIGLLVPLVKTCLSVGERQ